ncbi:MAG: hypothetical protein AAF481_03775 [Acidobacteriota bacterium]
MKRTPLAGLAAALLWLLLPAATAAEFTCDAASGVTAFAFDTRSGTSLLTITSTAGERWWVSLDGTGDARAWRQDESTIYAGSTGPGEIFALSSCGDTCAQPVRWRDGAWAPLGEAFPVPRGATLHSTWDRSGSPWILLHRRVGEGLQGSAFRLEKGEWRPHGRAAVRLGGAAGVRPDPDLAEAVISGSTRFAAGKAPSTWLRGLPRGVEGELIPIADRNAALVDIAGRTFLTADGGSRWSLSRWTPWGVQQTESWRPGVDYQVDVPTGASAGSSHLALAWFDRRRKDEPRLVLTGWSPAAGWKVEGELSPTVTTRDGVTLAWDYLLRPVPDRWLLMTGCIHTAAGSSLVVRELPAGGELSEPRLVSIR